MEEISSVAMLAAKKSAEVTPEVNIREQETHTHLSSGFETQRRRHQKTKTGVPVAPQKGLMSSKIFKNVTLYGINLQQQFSFFLQSIQTLLYLLLLSVYLVHGVPP